MTVRREEGERRILTVRRHDGRHRVMTVRRCAVVKQIRVWLLAGSVLVQPAKIWRGATVCRQVCAAGPSRFGWVRTTVLCPGVGGCGWCFRCTHQVAGPCL
jgi:hypothetical protein